MGWISASDLEGKGLSCHHLPLARVCPRGHPLLPVADHPGLVRRTQSPLSRRRGRTPPLGGIPQLMGAILAYQHVEEAQWKGKPPGTSQAALRFQREIPPWSFSGDHLQPGINQRATTKRGRNWRTAAKVLQTSLNYETDTHPGCTVMPRDAHQHRSAGTATKILEGDGLPCKLEAEAAGLNLLQQQLQYPLEWRGASRVKRTNSLAAGAEHA